MSFNLKKNSNPQVVGAFSRFWFMFRYGSNGQRNGFANVAGITDTAIKALISAPDYRDRIYPCEFDVENPTDERGENVIETSDGGTEAFVSRSARNVAVQFWEADWAIINQFDNMMGLDLAVFGFDANGTMTSITDIQTAETRYPFQIKSIQSRTLPASGSTVNKVEVKFSIPNTVRDGLMTTTTEAEVGLSFLNDYPARAGVFASKFVSDSATQTTLQLKARIGNVLVTGLDVDDVKLYNNTTSAAVTSTFVENPAGTYVIAHASGVTAGDILTPTLTHAADTSLFDFDEANEKTVTVE